MDDDDDDDDFAPPAPDKVKHVVPREVWMWVLAMADERGDLRPLAQMLEAGAPLPAAVREHLAYMFQDRRLQPKQPTLKTVLKRAIVLHAKGLYDKSKPLQGENAEQHRARFVREYNNKKNPRFASSDYRLTEAALTGLVRGTSRLARKRQKQKQKQHTPKR